MIVVCGVDSDFGRYSGEYGCVLVDFFKRRVVLFYWIFIVFLGGSYMLFFSVR